MPSKIRGNANSTIIGQSLANIAHKQFSLLGARATCTGQRDLGGTASNSNTLASTFVVDVLGEYDPGETASVKPGITNVMDTLHYGAAYRSGSPFTYVAPGRDLGRAGNEVLTKGEVAQIHELLDRADRRPVHRAGVDQAAPLHVRRPARADPATDVRQI